MSLLDAFFNKGFNGAKCKTLLKLTIPRIKLLRNRREVQLKHMRRDIAKLLETGQEATARIRVEHIIREESMMAAQEVVELFCELIVVRLPIIETQKECPLDLKEAISSVCFAAPRCSDLPELQQVQMLFASKYGREFVSAAAELLPDCGVNRQIIELLSVRAPSPEVKLKLLKEIAEEHDLDWDPSASEIEFLKPREDLLNGPTQLGPTQLDPTPLIGMSKLPFSIEKSLLSAPVQASQEQVDSDDAFDSLDFPEVPKVSLKPNRDLGSAPVVVSETPTSPDLESDNEITRSARGNESIPYEYSSESEKAVSDDPIPDLPSSNISVGTREDKQFLPFISSPSFSSASFSVKERERPKFGSTFSSTRSDADLDLEDVLAAAQAAAVSAEQAAAAARSAASLTQLRISELVQKRNDQVVIESRECTYRMDDSNRPTLPKTPTFDRGNSFGDNMNDSHSLDKELSGGPMTPKATYLDTHEVNSDVVPGSKEQLGCHPTHQPQRSSSLEDDPYFSYPNLFKSSDTKP